HRQRLDDEIVDRELVGRLAVGAGRGSIDLLTRGQKLADVAVEREIEMRDGGLRLDQAAGNDFSHIVMGNDFVAVRLEQRADFFIRRGCDGERRGGWRRSGSEPLARFRRLDVARDDAAMRPRSLNTREVDTGFSGQPPRERRGEDTVRAMNIGPSPLTPTLSLLGRGGALCLWDGS